MKSLPARPSLDSLRKQAKKLARDVAAGDAAAVARARAQLSRVDSTLSQRNAQLVIAREYGFAGWQDLVAEVSKRVGNGLDWAAAQAKRAIHDHDVGRLKELLAEYPALLSWQDDSEQTGVLGFATGAYGDAGDPEREQWFTRRESAEVLIDAGAVVAPAVVSGLVLSRARGLLEVFRHKGLLPRTLTFYAALGDVDATRAALYENANDRAAIDEAFITAGRFGYESVASLLLDRAIALDPELGVRVDGGVGRDAFIRSFSEQGSVDPERAIAAGPWRAFVMQQVGRAVHDDDPGGFSSLLKRERWILEEPNVWFQVRLIENATVIGRGAFISALLDLAPALVRRHPPPPSQAIEFALTYAHTELVPLLTRVWPLPNELGDAAGLGDFSRVRESLSESNTRPQPVLDTAFAYAVLNHHFDVADYLLAHGADINTRWNSHEPASILHTLVFEDDYEGMQYLIDRGIDMSIKDYRWNATAQGWARVGKGDEKMADWLKRAEEEREQRVS